MESSYNCKDDKRVGKNSKKNKHKLINVSEALEEAADMSDEEEVQVVLLSPDNPEVGDTDSELGNELDLVEQSIEQKFLERLKYKL